MSKRDISLIIGKIDESVNGSLNGNANNINERLMREQLDTQNKNRLLHYSPFLLMDEILKKK